MFLMAGICAEQFLFVCLFVYLEPRSRIEALYNFSVVKKTVGSISDGYHSTTAAVDVNAVHVSKRQADVCG